jgi:hypothetical protein
MKIQLVLEIDYDVSAVSRPFGDELAIRDDLEAILTTSVERLVGEGGLSGDTDATVNSWELSLGATVAGATYDARGNG